MDFVVIKDTLIPIHLIKTIEPVTDTRGQYVICIRYSNDKLIGSTSVSMPDYQHVEFDSKDERDKEIERLKLRYC